MNYEEMLEAREGAAMHRVDMPIGAYYKKLIDKKYRNVVELKPLLTDSVLFCEGLRVDYEKTSTLQSKNQMHFTLQSDSGGVYELELEQGNYVTLSQLVEQNPAIVAVDGFIKNIVAELSELVTKLNSEGIFTLNFAPQSIFIRKGDNTPLLLTHGSFFLGMGNQADLYGDFAEYVAPEVISEGTADERSEVYAFAKLIEFLYGDGGLPVEYRHVISKATSEDPSRRYSSIADMLDAATKRRSLLKSAASLAAALLLAALGFWLYFDMMPQATDIEFVQPRGPQDFDDLLDKGIDPTTELGLIVTDSAGNRLSASEVRSMEEYQAKAEQIFRKRFAQTAERILSDIYSNEHMNNTEKNFAATSRTTIEELMNAQTQLAEEAGLSNAKSQLIASEIIDQITERKKRELSKIPGYQKESAGD